MALVKKGAYYYGDSQFDIRAELLRYSGLNGYPTEHYEDARCECGKNVFILLVDEDEGVAVRCCTSCRVEHPIGDSEEYLEDATLEACECPCGGEQFEITAGVALYADSEDVRWLYLGCRCIECGLTAPYGDWKNECPDYREFLTLI